MLNDSLWGFIADLFKDMNMFLLNGAFGVLKFIFKKFIKIPHYIKMFFVKGLPWLVKRFGRILRYIFSSDFWKLVWNFGCFVPSLALFLFMFAWPFVGWYLTGKIDVPGFSYASRWWWLAGSFMWTVTIGYFGVRYGIKNEVFSGAYERIEDLFEPKSVKMSHIEARRLAEHNRRVKEEEEKLEDARRKDLMFKRMLETIVANKKTIDVIAELEDLFVKYQNKTITDEELRRFKGICENRYQTPISDAKAILGSMQLSYKILCDKWPFD